jgi:hypothetical protein
MEMEEYGAAYFVKKNLQTIWNLYLLFTKQSKCDVKRKPNHNTRARVSSIHTRSVFNKFAVSRICNLDADERRKLRNPVSPPYLGITLHIWYFWRSERRLRLRRRILFLTLCLFSNPQQGLKLRKQRSTGDLDKKGTTGNTSIRSTASSASWMSNDSAQSAVTSGSHHTDSNASFVVEVSQVSGQGVPFH